MNAVRAALWTREEIDAAVFLRKDGLTYKAIAEVLGRTEKAVKRALQRHGAIGIFEDREGRNLKADAAAGSEALQRAIVGAVSRFANDNQISSAEAAALLIGREPARPSCASAIPIRTPSTGHSPFEIVSGRFPPNSQEQIKSFAVLTGRS
jgi:hypothetical protein